MTICGGQRFFRVARVLLESAVAEDYLLVREDRPVPLCWRTPFQRQQSGKRHTLDQHFTGIARVIGNFFPWLSTFRHQTALHCSISWNNLIREISLFSSTNLKSHACSLDLFHTRVDFSSVTCQPLIGTRSFHCEFM